MRMNLKLFLLSLILFLLPLPTKTFGQTPTVEETSIASESASEIRKQAQEKILSLKEASNRRAFWGDLKEINNSTLLLENPKGERRIKTDEGTEFFSGKTKIKSTDLEIGNFIIALGYLDENSTLLAKRIISVKTAPKPATRRFVAYGIVSDVSEDEEILAVNHNKKDVTYEVAVDDKTVITKKVAGKIKKIAFVDIKTGDRLVAIGTKKSGEETITAKLIHIIPSQDKETQEPTPTSTQGAENTPTPEE